MLSHALAGLMLLPLPALGALWMRAALRTRDAFTAWVLGGFSACAAHAVALNALCYVVRPGDAAWMLFACESLAVLACWRRLRQPEAFDPTPMRADLGKLGWMLLGLGIFGYFSGVRAGITDQLNHANSIGVMQAHGLPMPHPYDPGQVFMYHYGSDLIGAAYGQALGASGAEMLDGWLGLERFWTLLLLVEFVRAAAARERRKLPRAAYAGGLLLFALGGSFGWLEWLAGRQAFLETLRRGFVEGFFESTRVPALGWGWPCFFGVLALALRWPDPARQHERQAPPHALTSPLLPLGLALAATMLGAPHVAAVLGGGLLVWCAARHLSNRESDTGAWALAGLLGMGLAAVQGGQLTGSLLGFSGGGQLELAWNGSLWPEFPAWGERVRPGQDGYVYFGWRELGPLLWTGPLLWAWTFWPRAQQPTAARIALALGIPALAFSIWFHLERDPIGLGRFTQLYTGCAWLALGVCAGSAGSPRLAAASRAGRWVLNLGGVLLLVGLSFETIRLGSGWLLRPHPAVPLRFAAGQVAALRHAATQDPKLAGVLAYGADGAPVAPALLGTPIRCIDPELNEWGQRTQAWQRAVRAPSAGSAQALGLAWICAAPEQMPHAIPLLEGRMDMEPHGAFGERDAYFLYRTSLRPLSGATVLARCAWLRREPVQAVAWGREPLERAAQVALIDGDPRSATELSMSRWAAEGLALTLRTPPGGRSPALNLIWVLADESVSDERAVQVLGRVGLECLNAQGAWQAVETRSLGDPFGPRARAWYVPEGLSSVSIRLRLAGAATEGTLRMAEFYAGAVGWDVGVPHE